MIIIRICRYRMVQVAIHRTIEKNEKSALKFHPRRSNGSSSTAEASERPAAPAEPACYGAPKLLRGAMPGMRHAPEVVRNI